MNSEEVLRKIEQEIRTDLGSFSIKAIAFLESINKGTTEILGLEGNKYFWSDYYGNSSLRTRSVGFGIKSKKDSETSALVTWNAKENVFEMRIEHIVPFPRSKDFNSKMTQYKKAVLELNSRLKDDENRIKKMFSTVSPAVKKVVGQCKIQEKKIKSQTTSEDVTLSAVIKVKVKDSVKAGFKQSSLKKEIANRLSVK